MQQDTLQLTYLGRMEGHSGSVYALQIVGSDVYSGKHPYHNRAVVLIADAYVCKQCAVNDGWAGDGVATVRFLATETTACAKRTGAVASVERWRHEPARVISPE